MFTVASIQGVLASSEATHTKSPKWQISDLHAHVLYSLRSPSATQETAFNHIHRLVVSNVAIPSAMFAAIRPADIIQPILIPAINKFFLPGAT